MTWPGCGPAYRPARAFRAPRGQHRASQGPRHPGRCLPAGGRAPGPDRPQPVAAPGTRRRGGDRARARRRTSRPSTGRPPWSATPPGTRDSGSRPSRPWPAVHPWSARRCRRWSRWSGTGRPSSGPGTSEGLAQTLRDLLADEARRSDLARRRRRAGPAPQLAGDGPGHGGGLPVTGSVHLITPSVATGASARGRSCRYRWVLSVRGIVWRRAEGQRSVPLVTASDLLARPDVRAGGPGARE